MDGDEESRLAAAGLHLKFWLPVVNIYPQSINAGARNHHLRNCPKLVDRWRR